MLGRWIVIFLFLVTCVNAQVTGNDVKVGDSNSVTDSMISGPITVPNGGTGATSLTDGGILTGSGTGAVSALGVATNGQIPIGDGTTDPVLAVITAEAGAEITITNGPGSIEVDVNEANLDLSSIGGTIGDSQIAAGAVDGGAGGEIADGSITVEDLETLLITDQFGGIIKEPTNGLNATDHSIATFFANRARAITITEVFCETDTGTVTLNLERDDGSAADILSADIVCDSNQQTSCASGCDVNTIQGTEDSLAIGDDINLAITSVATSPTRLSLFVTYTID